MNTTSLNGKKAVANIVGIASSEQELTSVKEYIENRKYKNYNVFFHTRLTKALINALNYMLAFNADIIILPSPERLTEEGVNPYVLQYSLKKRKTKLEFAEETTCPDNIEEYLDEYIRLEGSLSDMAGELNDMTDIHYHY
jgi:hypothetical protein